MCPEDLAPVPDSRNLVSVIVPAFNASRTLPRALDSLLSQAHALVEIIVVDDGSTDDTRRVADRYERLDHRVRVISQTNAGLASARNAGIAAARGVWITFLDADDWVDSDYLTAPLDCASRTNASVVIFGFFVDFHNSENALANRIMKLPSRRETLVSRIKPAEVDAKFLNVLGYAWNKLYRLCSPAERVYFEPGLTLIEDMEFQSRAMPRAAETALCPRAVVHYTQPAIADTLGRRFRNDSLDLRWRWVQCAQSLVDRWALTGPAADVAFIHISIGSVYEMCQRVWALDLAATRRITLIRQQLARPENASFGRSVARHAGVSWRYRTAGLALCAFARFAPAPARGIPTHGP